MSYAEIREHSSEAAYTLIIRKFFFSRYLTASLPTSSARRGSSPSYFISFIAIWGGKNCTVMDFSRQYSIIRSMFRLRYSGIISSAAPTHRELHISQTEATKLKLAKTLVLSESQNPNRSKLLTAAVIFLCSIITPLGFAVEPEV